MNVVCLDLEGVLVPEIWIAFAEASGIPQLKRTTRDEPDYNKLMEFRLGILKEHGLGLKEIQDTIAKIDPIPGAKEFLDELCVLASEEGRVMAGEFLYVTDIMFNPSIISKAAIILATYFYGKGADYVITVETKGIPLAYEVAKCLGVPMVTARRDSKVTEGSTVSINYVSGTSKRIQQMCLSRKSLKSGSKCIFIDDFMRGGGTANGIIDLLKEFDSELVGSGVLIDNKMSSNKVSKNYISLVDILAIDDKEGIKMVPSETLI